MVLWLETCRDGMILWLETCRDDMVLWLERCWYSLVLRLERCCFSLILGWLERSWFSLVFGLERRQIHPQTPYFSRTGQNHTNFSRVIPYVSRAGKWLERRNIPWAGFIWLTWSYWWSVAWKSWSWSPQTIRTFTEEPIYLGVSNIWKNFENSTPSKFSHYMFKNCQIFERKETYLKKYISSNILENSEYNTPSSIHPQGTRQPPLGCPRLKQNMKHPVISNS